MPIRTRDASLEGWLNSTVLRGPLVDEVHVLRQAPGRDIVATGSIRLVRVLIRARWAPLSRTPTRSPGTGMSWDLEGMERPELACCPRTIR